MGDMEFNSMLINVSKHLNDNDLKSMKFMCKDIIKKRDMEKVTTPLDLFTELQSREKLTRSDTSFLKNLLLTLEKSSAIRVIDQFENNLNPAMRNMQQPMDMTPGLQYQTLQQAHPVGQHVLGHEPVSNRADALRKEFNFLTKNLSREWRFYLRALGMEDAEVDMVETDYPRSLRDQIYQSLVLWVKQNKDKATKTELIKALRDGSVERFDLASKLEKGNY